MKKKGFTLIELLVVFVILGIVLVIAVQSYHVLIQNNDKSKYTYYLDLIKMGADLHLESKRDDMKDGECLAVDYQRLVEKNFLKEEDITCSGILYLRKTGKRYDYDDHMLSCKTKSNGKILKEKEGELDASCKEVH